MNTESGIPVTGLYADEAPSGYIEPPTNTQFHSGVEPEMTLPAAWWNYFVNLFTNTNIKTKEDITAILAELNNALTTMGITPDPEASNQLATLFQNDVLPVTFADASMNANPYTTSSLVPKHRGNIAINTTTRTTWIATNTTAAAASWSRLWSPENDGSGSGLDADKVRSTTPGTRGLQYLAAAAVSNIAALILSDLKTVDGSGSGLDADLLDGLHANSFMYENPTAIASGSVLSAFTKSGAYTALGSSTDQPENTTIQYLVNYYDTNTCSVYATSILSGLNYTRKKSGGVWAPGWTLVYTSSNDGSGSGLDADLLDGLQGAAYAKVNTATSSTATDLPVGSYIIATEEARLTPVDKNTIKTIRLSGKGYSFDMEGQIGAIMSGTWRTSGYAYNYLSQTHLFYHLMRRVA